MRRKPPRDRRAARKFRLAVLRRDPLCRSCGAQATDAHHLRNGAMGKRDHRVSNGIGLCRTCHMALHASGKESWAQVVFGMSYAELCGKIREEG